MQSEKIGIPVIDISNTTLAVYQDSGLKPRVPLKDANVNVKITGGFDFTKGLISCAPYKTKNDSSSESGIVLYRRRKYGMCGKSAWERRKVDRCEEVYNFV